MGVQNTSIKELVSLNSIAMGDSYGIATRPPARDEMRPLLSCAVSLGHGSWMGHGGGGSGNPVLLLIALEKSQGEQQQIN